MSGRPFLHKRVPEGAPIGMPIPNGKKWLFLDAERVKKLRIWTKLSELFIPVQPVQQMQNSLDLIIQLEKMF